MNIAFVIGVARSGTSILGELIAAHPEVKYTYEPHQIWEVAGSGVNDSHRLVAEHATPAVKAQIRQWFDKQTGHAGIVVEKNPRNVLRVPFVRQVFPEGKIVHIVRDGRDVACSMAPGCGGKQWSHLKPPSWRELFSRYEGPVRCALTWKETMEIALRDLAEGPHMQLRFEDLVRQPHQTASDVLNYLELENHPVVMTFCEKIQDATAGSYHAEHQGFWYRNDHQTRIGRYRENLTAEHQREINEVLASLLLQLEYELDAN